MFRDLYRVSYLSRGRFRKTRRSISESIKLGLIARELVNYYLKILYWSEFNRIIEVEL